MRGQYIAIIILVLGGGYIVYILEILNFVQYIMPDRRRPKMSSRVLSDTEAVM